MRRFWKHGRPPTSGGGTYTGTSPTGRDPKLLWSPAKQGVYDQMKVDFDAAPSAPVTLGGQLYKMMKDHAEPSSNYFENGLYSAWMYQATGDAAYAQKAWDALEQPGNYMNGTNGGNLSFFARPSYASNTGLSGNFLREHFTSLVVIYDRIYPWMDSSKKSQFLAQLNVMAQLVALTISPSGEFRHDDTDEMTGGYFGIVALYAATVDHNPSIISLFNNAEVGGLEATGANLSTSKRNTLKYYVDVLGQGGEWMESSEYNLGTTTLLVWGAEAARLSSVVGPGYFTDIAAYYPDLAKRQIMNVCPGTTDAIQWGDEQEPRLAMSLSYGLRREQVNLAMLLAGALEGTTIGQQMQDYVIALGAQTSGFQGTASDPFGHALYTFNPYAVKASNWQAIGTTHFAPGQGMGWFHDGWGINDSLFWCKTFPAKAFVDHTQFIFSHWQLWRNGNWAVTNPLAYASGFTFGFGGQQYVDTVNGLRYVGAYGVMPMYGSTSTNAEVEKYHAYGSIRGQKPGPDYYYQCATIAGPARPPFLYNPAPVFLHEHTRSYLYLAGSTKQADVVIIYDRLNIQDPVSLTRWPTSYYASNPPEASQITNKLGRFEWFIHMPTAPMVGGVTAGDSDTFLNNGSTIDWLTAAGDLAKVECLFPLLSHKRVYDESHLWGQSGYTSEWIGAPERKWQAIIYPATAVQWNPILTVTSVRDVSTGVSSTVLKDDTNFAYGTIVHRTGENDVVAIFNGIQGPTLAAFPSLADIDAYPATLDTVRLRGASTYTIPFISATALTRVFLLDLNPAKSWTKNVDTGGAVAIVPDSNGLYETTIPGIGAHSITVVGV